MTGGVGTPDDLRGIACQMRTQHGRATVAVDVLGTRAPHDADAEPIPQWVRIYVCEACRTQLGRDRPPHELRDVDEPPPVTFGSW